MNTFQEKTDVFAPNAARTKLVPTSEIDRLNHRIRANNEEVAKLKSVVSSIADRLFGTCPECDKPESRPLRCGVIGEQEDLIDFATEGLKELGNEIDRLSRL